ncbi:MAG TPA: type I polyketide synthase [Symbiobacteriaceae bacterium]|jgi:myxalamid-type polyketide synthase MxaE and MxaD
MTDLPPERIREPIAIIGIGCRMPGANNPGEFWDLLRDGVDAVTEVPRDRWDVDRYYDRNGLTPGKTNCRTGGFLNDIERFDAGFFGISPREAVSLDPQHRLLMETAWEALEDGGQVPARLAGSQTGVFIGWSYSDYFRIMWRDVLRLDAYSGTGTTAFAAANRLSFFFDFRGPSIALDTACSSSLVAVHLACESLRRRECPLALAGAVNIMLTPDIHIHMSKLGALSRSGRSHTFDAAADGYVRGEGAGMVVLKLLSEALQDGDPIYAVIRSSVTNQDGRSTALTTPNRDAQVALLREAYRQAGVSPGRVHYVEAHGTGTPLGDPIEVECLASVLGEGRPADRPCAIGSVKSNIGHLEPAAGMSSLIKVALSLKHGLIPPSLHFKEPNPMIPFASMPVVVQQVLSPWPTAPGEAALAGISAFGLGGSNAHVVLEQAPGPEPAPRVSAPGPWMLAISAHVPEALRAYAGEYIKLLETPDAVPGDICYTAAVRHTHHKHRLVVAGQTREALARSLRAFLNGKGAPGLAHGEVQRATIRKLAFVFPGQGPQWWAMGRQLLEREPVFRRALEECDAIMSRYADWSLLAELTADESSSRVNETDMTQPAIFALQIALAELWRSWGIMPDAVVGHSMGEVAAAVVAGILTREEGAHLIVERARLMKRAGGIGKIAAVGLPLAEVREWLKAFEGRLNIAASNSPTSTAVSGDADAVDELVAALEQKEVFVRELRMNLATHSHHMDAARPELEVSLAGLAPQPGSVTFFSTVTGRAEEGGSLGAAYWGQNLRNAVLFAPTVEQMAQAGVTAFLELSPHPTLTAATGETLRRMGREDFVLSCLRRDDDETKTMRTALGALYVHGYPVAWERVYPSGTCVGLPLYPWQRERYWLPYHRPGVSVEEAERTSRTRSGAGHPLLGPMLAAAQPRGTFYWDQLWSSESLEYLRHHCVQGDVLMPAAAYIEMVLAAARQGFGDGARALADITFAERLVLLPDQPRQVQLVLSTESDQWAAFSVLSCPGDDATRNWTLHVTGRIQLGANLAANLPATGADQSETQWPVDAEPIDVKAMYRLFSEQGIEYGPTFRGVKEVRASGLLAFGRVRPVPQIESEASAYGLHPTLLDAALHVGEYLAVSRYRSLYLPVHLDRFHFWRRPDGEIKVRVRLHAEDSQHPELLTADFWLYSRDGERVADLQGLQLRRLAGIARPPAEDGLLYEVEWQPKPLPTQADQVSEGTWLILAPHDAAGTALGDRLAAEGRQSVLVFAGETYQAPKDGVAQINPVNPEDFRRLLQDIFGNRPGRCAGVAHLWGLDTPTGELLPSDLDRVQELGCKAVLHLVQALALTGWSTMPRLGLVTRGARAVKSQERFVSAAQASLVGMAQVVALEMPALRSLSADLDPGASAVDVAVLAAELLTADDENQVAYRGGQRYVPRLVRMAPAGISAGRNADSVGNGLTQVGTIRNDSTYLVTGGLTGLGLLTAQWLVQTGAQHLVLVGRRPASTEAAAIIDGLRATGADVLIQQCDVSDREQLARLLDEIRRALPPLRGVVHAAGALDDGLLVQLTAERFDVPLRPKVYGGWNLHVLTQHDPLDFFVLYSSAAAVLGSAGQANYAAANAFMDALAHDRSNRGLPAISINWGPWSGIGMTAQSDRAERFAWNGLGLIAPDSGLQVLERLFSTARVQAVVLDAEWNRLVQAYPQGAQTRFFAKLVEIDQAAEKTRVVDWRGRLAETDATGGRGLLESLLQAEVARILRLAPARVDIHVPLNRQGLDSLTAMEVRNRLEAELKVAVPVTRFLTGADIAELAGELAGLIARAPAQAAPVVAEQSASIGQGEARQILDRIDQISEDQVKELLRSMLAKGEGKS